MTTRRAALSLLAVLPFTTGWERYEAQRCPDPFIYTGNPVYDMLDLHLRNWGKMHRDMPQALVLLNPALAMLTPPQGWSKRWETRFTFATAPPEAAGQMGPWAILPLCEGQG